MLFCPLNISIDLFFILISNETLKKEKQCEKIGRFRIQDWLLTCDEQDEFNLKNMGSLGKNGEKKDNEVEQLIDGPTNGSGDPDLGQIFLQI